jgi:hypothetical protein
MMPYLRILTNSPRGWHAVRSVKEIGRGAGLIRATAIITSRFVPQRIANLSKVLGMSQILFIHILRGRRSVQTQRVLRRLDKHPYSLPLTRTSTEPLIPVILQVPAPNLSLSPLVTHDNTLPSPAMASLKRRYAIYLGSDNESDEVPYQEDPSSSTPCQVPCCKLPSV